MTDPRGIDYENNIIAAGGVLAALHVAAGVPPPGVDLDPEVVMENGTATNMLTVRLGFMKSRYRLTVERVPDDE